MILRTSAGVEFQPPRIVISRDARLAHPPSGCGLGVHSGAFLLRQSCSPLRREISASRLFCSRLPSVRSRHGVSRQGALHVVRGVEGPDRQLLLLHVAAQPRAGGKGLAPPGERRGGPAIQAAHAAAHQGAVHLVRGVWKSKARECYQCAKLPNREQVAAPLLASPPASRYSYVSR